jgi:hypothetical protein
MPEGVPFTATTYSGTGGTSTSVSTYTWTTSGTTSGYLVQTGGTIFTNYAPATHWERTAEYERTVAPMTPEQTAEYERVFEEQRRADEEFHRAQEERQARRNAAEARARELLETLLDEEQLASYRDHEFFDVTGSAGNRYRIRRGNSGNVHWLGDEGEILGRLCAHPSLSEDWLPLPDVAAGQMLALVTDEPTFIGHANVHEGRRPIFPELEGHHV